MPERTSHGQDEASRRRKERKLPAAELAEKAMLALIARTVRHAASFLTVWIRCSPISRSSQGWSIREHDHPKAQEKSYKQDYGK